MRLPMMSHRDQDSTYQYMREDMMIDSKGLCTGPRIAVAAVRLCLKDLSGLACRAVHGSGEFPRGVDIFSCDRTRHAMKG